MSRQTRTAGAFARETSTASTPTGRRANHRTPSAASSRRRRSERRTWKRLSTIQSRVCDRAASAARAGVTRPSIRSALLRPLPPVSVVGGGSGAGCSPRRPATAAARSASGAGQRIRRRASSRKAASCSLERPSGQRRTRAGSGPASSVAGVVGWIRSPFHRPPSARAAARARRSEGATSGIPEGRFPRRRRLGMAAIVPRFSPDARSRPPRQRRLPADSG